MNLKNLMREAARSIVTRSAALKLGKVTEILVICGKHNSFFADNLVTECCAQNVFPHLWVWDEKLLPAKKKVAPSMTKLPRYTLSLLKKSELVIWLTQYENPRNAEVELGTAVCSYWDEVDKSIRGKPVLYVNLFSERATQFMGIEYAKYLSTFADAVNVDYEKMRRTGVAARAALEGRKLVTVKDSNGTDLSVSIENRRIGIEVGTLEDCFKNGKECEVEIPSGEVYVAPVETSARGLLVVDQVRDFCVKKLEMTFEKGRISQMRAESGEKDFRSFLEKAQGGKNVIAEFGIGINPGMRPIGLRISDEKALGTIHLAIGNNRNLGGNNDSSIHIDFNLYHPTVTADDMMFMENGNLCDRDAL